MTTTDLPFPFWLLIHRGESPWRPVVWSPGFAAAFTTHARAGEFLARSGNPGWEVRLVVRPTLAAAAEGFRQQGVIGLTLDPGESGEQIRFRPGNMTIRPAVAGHRPSRWGGRPG